MNKQITNSILSSKFYFTAAFLIAVAAFTTQIQAGVLIPKLVSRALNGAAGNDSSFQYSVNADGRFIAFASSASNLVTGINDTNTTTDIFLMDTTSNSISCLSLANPTTTGNQFSANPKITPDGRYVVFTSFSDNLVANDTNNTLDIFRVDTTTGEIRMVSRNLSGTNGGNNMSGEFNGGTLPFDVSDNGRYVIFESKATDLSNVSDTNNQPDVFLRDVTANATRLISFSSSSSSTGNGYALNPNISSDGKIVTFESNASNLVAGMMDLNSGPDVFIRNLQTNQTKYVSFSQVDPTFAAPGGGYYSVLSKNGTRVAYVSNSSALVTPNPTGVARQVIVYDVGVRANALVSINFSGDNGGNQESGNEPSNLNITPDGRYVFFDSSATNLTPEGFDNNNARDIFRRDLQLGETELVTLSGDRTAIANRASFIGTRNTAISSDGRYVVFKSSATNLLIENITTNAAEQVFVRDMQTLTTSLVSPNKTGNGYSSGFARFYSISSNGKAVVYTSNAADIAQVDENNGDDVFYRKLTSPTVSDFDGDGRTDVAVYRPSIGTWYSLPADGFVNIRNWGNSSDRIVPADYDGDGKTDHAVFRASENNWYLQKSIGIVAETVQFGLAGDIPAPADFDGDGKADIAVFRPSNSTWYIRQSSDGQVRFQNFGLSGDLPVVGDYDGDTKADVAVFRPSGNTWYILRSSDNSFVSLQFGINTDKLVPADYDGDGKTDIAVFRPADQTWYIYESRTNQIKYVNFGLSSDAPTPGDYDGDGMADIAVFRPSSGDWYILRSSNGALAGSNWGMASDVPVPAAYVP